MDEYVEHIKVIAKVAADLQSKLLEMVTSDAHASHEDWNHVIRWASQLRLWFAGYIAGLTGYPVE